MSSRMFLITTFLLAIMFVIPNGTVKAGRCLDETPLPDNLQFADSSRTAKGSEFLGLWSGGKWSGKLCGTLAVTKINDNGSVNVIFSRGWYTPWGVYPAYEEVVAQIDDSGKLTFKTPSGKKVEFWISDGNLKGTFYGSRGKRKITLYKQDIS